MVGNVLLAIGASYLGFAAGSALVDLASTRHGRAALLLAICGAGVFFAGLYGHV